MNDNPTLLSYEARQTIDERVRRAQEGRVARAVSRRRRARRHDARTNRLDL